MEEETGLAGTVEKAAKKLIAAKKTLEEQVNYLEKRFAGVVDIETEAAKLIGQVGP